MSPNNSNKQGTMNAECLVPRCQTQLLEGQAAPTHGATPMLCGDSVSTDVALGRRAKQLAHYLSDLGASPEDLLAIRCNRSDGNERSTVEHSLGYFRRLLEGIAGDEQWPSDLAVLDGDQRQQGPDKSNEKMAGPDEDGISRPQLDYWEENLAGVPESIDLPTDYPRASAHKFAGITHLFALDAQLTRQLKDLAEQSDGSLFMVLIAAVKLLLYRYTGQQNICIGSLIASPKPEGQNGTLVETLLVRTQLDQHESFYALFSRVKAAYLEACELRNDAPGGCRGAVFSRSQSGPYPPFQVFVLMQNAAEETLDPPFPSYPFEDTVGECDFAIEFRITAESLGVSIQFNAALYKQQTIDRMAEHFVTLCRAIVATPTVRISDLDYLSQSEKRRLLIDNNATRADYPKNKCLHVLFLEQVELHPGKAAVRCRDAQLTYGQLCEKSHSLALYLQSIGVKPDSLVGICANRSLDMVVGMLGVMRAGGAYVPLDPIYPDERLAYMLKDSQADIVLTQEELKDKLTAVVPTGTRLVALDKGWAEIERCANELKATNVSLDQVVKPHHLAYVIYTSGSTGKPKGVAIEHRSPVAMAYWARDVWDRQEFAGVLAATSICFDLSVYEIFVTLANGGTIILAPNALGLVNLSHKETVTLINTVPSAMEELVRLGAIPNSVRTINLAGEPLSPRLVNKIYATTAVQKIYDLYGPTEDTTYSTYMLRDQNSPQTIGRPIANTQIYILDSHNRVQPIGVPGELYIAGDGLARGYLNRPELTQEKFVANPFQPGTRMYKTGDLARWLEEGTLQYLGRIDNQVKIRGFRIELGEIQVRLMENDLVQDAAVVVREDEVGDKRLVAYVVPATKEEQKGVSTEETTNTLSELATALRAYLAGYLPEYMVPTAFVPLNELPLLPNGKLDRKRLPAPNGYAYASGAYEAPVGEAEAMLACIWKEVLKMEKVGRQDNFFALGGHSLLSLRLVNRLEQEGIKVTAQDIFEHVTIESLAATVEFQGRRISADRAICIRQGGSEPLFFTHEGTGQLFYVPALTPYIEANISIYGLPAKAAYEPQAQTIEEMASRMVTMIRATQPLGPYRVAGWSFGGILAYEVAVQLVAAGEEVEFIGLIDTAYVAGAKDRVDECKGGFDEKSQLQIEIEEIVTDYSALSVEEQLQTLAKIGSAATTSDFDGFVQKCREMMLLPSRWVDLNREQLRQSLFRIYSCRSAAAQYSAPPLAVPVYLFRAEDHSNKSDPLLGWNTALPERQIRVIHIPGTHLSIMTQPTIALLGQALSHAIQNAKPKRC